MRHIERLSDAGVLDLEALLASRRRRANYRALGFTFSVSISAARRAIALVPNSASFTECLRR